MTNGIPPSIVAPLYDDYLYPETRSTTELPADNVATSLAVKQQTSQLSSDLHPATHAILSSLAPQLTTKYDSLPRTSSAQSPVANEDEDWSSWLSKLNILLTPEEVAERLFERFSTLPRQQHPEIPSQNRADDVNTEGVGFNQLHKETDRNHLRIHGSVSFRYANEIDSIGTLPIEERANDVISMRLNYGVLYSNAIYAQGIEDGREYVVLPTSSGHAFVNYDSDGRLCRVRWESLKSSTKSLEMIILEETPIELLLKTIIEEAPTKPLEMVIQDENPPPHSRSHRRGRGKRKNDSYWNSFNAQDDPDPFDGRECLFESPDGAITTPALANIDTGLKIPGGLVMRPGYAKQLGLYHLLDRNFPDPGMRSVSGHKTPIEGIIRNVVFRMKGTSITLIRDFYVSSAIEGLADIMLGAAFVKEHFVTLFQRVRDWASSTFATWFSTRKESAEEREERERREREQRITAMERDVARLKREHEEKEKRNRQMGNMEGRWGGRRRKMQGY